jgi:cytoskeletal protein RodZ
MSIIYDALKKVEQAIPKDPVLKTDKKDSKFNLKVFLLYGLVACVGFFIANMLFGLFTKPLQNSAKPVTKIQPQVNINQGVTSPPASELPKEAPSLAQESNLSSPAENEEKPQPLLVLNGIFFSENEGYALLNNKIVKKGDVVDGATVVRITLEGVELKFKDSVIKITTGSR